jgi:hypothetical protein
MRFIKPIAVTPATLISTNVPETDYSAWSATATYAITNRVTLDHHNWEAVAAVPAGIKPGAEVVTATSPAKWLDLGATNRWKAFDDLVGTLTTNPGTITFTIRPGTVVNSLALFNVQGQSVTVTMTDPIEGVVYTKNIGLIDAGVDNWYDWFFEEIDTRTSLVVLDMPAYGTATVTVTVFSSSIAAIGTLAIGKLVVIGTTVYGAGVGIDDYSTKERDKFGYLKLVEGEYSDSGDFSIVVDTNRVAKIKRMLAEIRATLVVWIAEETYEATIIFGFYKSFNEVYSGLDVSDMQLTIEGVI